METTSDLLPQIDALLKALPASLGAAVRTAPKQRVPMSGLTNALTGQDMFLEEHEYPAYMDLGAQFIAELRPVNVRETQIAQKIIDLNWRLNTISAVENNLFHSSRLAHIAPNDPNDDKIVGMTSKAATWRKDCEGPNAFEKLGRHETRIQRSLFRMTAEFERLQTIRLKNPTADSFVLEDCKAWVWYDHMLALHTQLTAARRAEAEAATHAASTTSDPELLCKIPNAPPPTEGPPLAPLVQSAAANGPRIPERIDPKPPQTPARPKAA